MFLGTLEHFISPEKALDEARRVLKDGGQLCIVVPNLYYIKNIQNMWRKEKKQSTEQILEISKTVDSWKKFFCNNGLEVIKIYKDNHILRYISRQDGLFRKVVKFIIKPFLFSLPTYFSFQVVFICKKRLIL